MSTLGKDYPDPIPVNPRFIKNCYSCNNPIDPISGAPLAKEIGHNQYQCLHCQTKAIDDVILKIDPHSDKAKQIIYKRMREMQEKLKQDEINHIRKQNRIKITVKSPKRFQKQKQGQGQPQKQVKEQLQQPQTKKSKLKIFIRRKQRQQQQHAPRSPPHIRLNPYGN